MTNTSLKSMLISLMVFLSLVLFAKESNVTETQNETTAVASLELTVIGIQNISGTISISGYADAESYKQSKDSAFDSIVEVKKDTITTRFNDLQIGSYIIEVFHDVDGNGKLNTNFFGIPNEPVGFSNSAKASFGPPSFDEAKFIVHLGINNHTISLEDL